MKLAALLFSLSLVTLSQAQLPSPQIIIENDLNPTELLVIQCEALDCSTLTFQHSQQNTPFTEAKISSKELNEYQRSHSYAVRKIRRLFEFGPSIKIYGEKKFSRFRDLQTKLLSRNP